MRNTSVLSIITAIMLSCNSKDIPAHRTMGSHIISVVQDMTDELLLVPKADPILQLFACNQHPDDAIKLRHRELGDKIHSELKVFELPNGFLTAPKNRLDDPKYRRKEILAFYNKVRSFYTRDTQRTVQSLEYSECLRTIGSELYYLSKDSSTDRKLLVFSDLKENSGLLSVYRDGIPSTQQVESIITQSQLFPLRLDGIRVFFIYQAHTRDEEKLFNGMVSLYEQVIKKRGGKVVIQSSDDLFVE